MKQKNHSKDKKNITKTHKDKGLQYYKETIRKKDMASPVISLPEFVQRYKKYRKDVDSLIYGGAFIPNIPHNCNGNSLYLASVLLNGEFYYIEGVLKDNEHLYHHAWLYSKTLHCYIDPTIDPLDMKYYLSDVVKDMKGIETLANRGNLFNIGNPLWINKDIKPTARVVKK